MLMGSDINPFDSQETKPYKNDPRISAMTDLVDAYQSNEIHRYEDVLQKNKDLLQDPFIAENIDEVTRNIRTNAVLKLVAPYTRFTLRLISRHLKISETEAQDIVGFLIVDGRMRGKINQSNGTVEIESSADTERTQAMKQWSSELGSLWATILNEGDGFKADDGSLVPYSGAASGGGLGVSGVGSNGRVRNAGTAAKGAFRKLGSK